MKSKLESVPRNGFQLRALEKCLGSKGPVPRAALGAARTLPGAAASGTFSAQAPFCREGFSCTQVPAWARRAACGAPVFLGKKWDGICWEPVRNEGWGEAAINADQTLLTLFALGRAVRAGWGLFVAPTAPK